jgi:hypothetical protein
MSNQQPHIKVILVLVFSGAILSMMFGFSAANATYNETSNTTSADIPSDVNDPGLPSATSPELSNTTSADIPSDVNDPGLPSATSPELSNTTSADIPSDVNDPGLPSAP